jgi:hypothetical protein
VGCSARLLPHVLPAPARSLRSSRLTLHPPRAPQVSIEPLARALVALPSFLPDLKALTGRAVQIPGASWLGPFFSVRAPAAAAGCWRRLLARLLHRWPGRVLGLPRRWRPGCLVGRGRSCCCC